MPGISSGRLAKLLAARRQFEGYDLADAPPQFRIDEHGGYFPDERVAVWDDNPQTRRHEVMHGIRDIASQNPELADVLPWWARNAKPGGFEDELLARLAGGDVRDWPMGAYFRDDPLKYALAMPVHAVATNPLDVAIGAGAVGGGALVYGLSKKDQQQAQADELDRIIQRLEGR